MECFCLDFMRDGKSIISGWSDGKVRAFLPQSGKLLYAINDAHKNGVTALALSSDCGRIAPCREYVFLFSQSCNDNNKANE